MGNLNRQSWDELWNSEEAEQVRKQVRCCDRNCWMIGSVSPAMHKYIWVPGIWVVWHKFKALFMKKPYSMYGNKIVRGYRDGKVTKEAWIGAVLARAAWKRIANQLKPNQLVLKKETGVCYESSFFSNCSDI